MKIAFVGHAAVGKDTLSDYASVKLGLAAVSSGDLVRQYILKNNLGGLERENVRKTVNMLRATKGGDYLVKEILERHPDNVVITGLRALDEVTTFKERGGVVIAVTAPPERRYELAKNRNRIDDTVTYKEWLQAEQGDDHNAQSNQGNVSAVIGMADYHIENLGTLDDLYQKCDELLNHLKERHKLTL